MAKVEHYYTQFEIEGIYHIYNRTVDRKPMFTSQENYAFFIRQFDKYLSDYVKIYSYCLLENHFHFMIKISDVANLKIHPQDLTTFEKLSNLTGENIKLDNNVTNRKLVKTTHEIVSHQFKKFFQSYAMAFNKQENRIGTLFQTPFKRVRISDEDYLRELILYINTNAQKHGLVEDFRSWKWSSYHKLISQKDSKLMTNEVIAYFDTINNFEFCLSQHSEKISVTNKDFFIEE